MSSIHPRKDLTELARAADVDLDAALDKLREYYAFIDAKNAANTKDLDLPCARGCSDCCHESVFLTPLEFFGLWDYVQQNASDEERTSLINDGLALYEENAELIESFMSPAESPEELETRARKLQFRCPYLDGEGACGVYPMRELLGRVFGCSFNDERGIYGCHLSGEYFGDKTVTLLRASSVARKLNDLPLTYMKQVHPWYIHWLYAPRDEKGART